MNVDPKTLKTKIFFGLSAIPDQLTYQAFTFLIFTYYFAVVRIDMTSMWLAYVLWGVWNAINDPLLGSLSDRTRQKHGRRIYLYIAIVPLCLMMIFLFTAPFNNQLINFLYFLFVILLFEGVYTLYDVNVNALFPEMFPTEKERASTNLFVKGFTVLALVFSFLLPTVIIPRLVISTDFLLEKIVIAYFVGIPELPFALLSMIQEVPQIASNYIFNGVILAIITAVFAIPFLMFGIKEPEEDKEIHEKRPGFFGSLKITLKNKTFVKFVVANTCIWYIFGLLPTILPLYSVYVLGIDKDSILIGISLLLAFIVAALVFPLHRKIGQKIGMRNGLILTCIVWLFTLSGYVFLFNNELARIISIFVTAIQGFGLSGAMYYVDILIGDVIDQDELKIGARRSGSFYGINAFINRLSIILMITSIALVFSGTGWSQYSPAISDPLLIAIGLKVLIFVFPAIAILIAVFFLKKYELHGETLEKMRTELNKKRSETP
ncbi:MAG: MFS transporter [Candidatus Helarchaeota archaeon]